MKYKELIYLTSLVIFTVFTTSPYAQDLAPHLKKKKTNWVIAANVAGYGGTMVALYSAWYSQYPQSSFHSFNDWKEWKQVDKAGHLYSAYIESIASMELWRWAGMERKKRIWFGGLSGAAYQTAIEILDGFSKEWGWSWGDFGANLLGSGTLIAQELAWDEQRIRLKFSFHRMNYIDNELNRRTDQLFGHSFSERMLKDYNGQTYWASVSLKPFFSCSKLPNWLSIAVGYGASGLFGGRENKALDANGNITFNRPDILRKRQWYLSPDIDWKRIPTKKKGIKFLFSIMNAFKMPAPAFE
ncbi:MAG: DUF2279 domain-containing protein, partial [Chitinophagaceae bacterium]